MEANNLGLPFEPLVHGTSTADWSNLPADLVATISKKLHDLFDFVYFRAVCKQWRTATSISDLPPQFPWVFERHNNGYLRVYSLINGKARSIHCPKSRDMCRYRNRASHGYLYGDMIDRHRYCLLNPLTNDDIRRNCLLNPLTNDEVFVKFEEDFDGWLLCMSPDPMGSYNHIAFFDESDYGKLGFYQPSIREWCYVRSPIYAMNWSLIRNQSCLKGYYIIATDTVTVVTDIASGSSFSVPSPDVLDISDNVYFVESAGKILRIVKRFDRGSVSSSFNYSFGIYQLDVIDKNSGYRWLKISSIGNQILFLDRLSGGISIACGTTGLRGNCIYGLHYCNDDIIHCEVIYRYNIGEGRIEEISSPPFQHNANWFVPCIIGSLSVDRY